ncbi:MAG: PEP-CTERM sorting domain-containing protein [Okeania sp. SIO2C9]|nr:PEP-CTERM sorting domain-containing protein [Okeania sp. SIO2C9]
MKQFSLLKKLLPVGISLGMLSVPLSLVVSPSARAATFTPGECGRLTGSEIPMGSITCFDKTFSNFELIAEFDIPAGAQIIIGVASDGETFELELDPGQTLGSFIGTATYDVTIANPDFFFDQVGLNSDVTSGGVEAQVTDGSGGTGNLLLELVSSDGNSVTPTPILGPTMYQFISVMNTVSIPEGGTFDGFKNTFTQKRVTPEPGTILGLLAVGGLGLGLKRKKQA